MTPMKAMKAGMQGKALTKGALAQAIADETEMKKSEVTRILDSLSNAVTSEMKKARKYTIPGVCMIETRVKPATKAGKREMFGKVVTDVVTSEMKKAGKYTIPGVCMIETSRKPAAKAGKRGMFGKVVTVATMKTRTVVKEFSVAALKRTI